jgi:hypothetical protein
MLAVVAEHQTQRVHHQMESFPVEMVAADTAKTLLIMLVLGSPAQLILVAAVAALVLDMLQDQAVPAS